MISEFHRIVNDICPLLRFYAVDQAVQEEFFFDCLTNENGW